MLFLQGPKATITALAFTRDGSQLALGGSDGSIDLIDETGTLQHLAPGVLSAGPVTSLVFTSEGTTKLYQCGNAQCRDVYDFRAGHWQKLEVPDSPITALAAFENGILAIGTGTGNGHGAFRLWDCVKNSSRQPTFREPSGARGIAAHSDSGTVAWSNGDNRISIWRVNTLEPKQLMLKKSAKTIAFHPEGELLAAALEWQIHIFDVNTRLERSILKGHTGRVTGLGYHPAGRFLATSSWDKTVRFWDTTTGTLLATFDWQIGRVQALAFAADGLRIAAGGEDGKIAVWDVE
jgi:WD40 repeat protein